VKMDPDKLFYCKKCDDRLGRIILDGIYSGDNLMENIRFLFITRPGEPACMGVHEDDKKYFGKFNYGYWINLMNKVATQEEYGQCPICGEDVPIWGILNPKKKSKPKKIKSKNSMYINNTVRTKTSPEDIDSE